MEVGPMRKRKEYKDEQGKKKRKRSPATRLPVDIAESRFFPIFLRGSSPSFRSSFLHTLFGGVPSIAFF
jgi:hypothetical protein